MFTNHVTTAKRSWKIVPIFDPAGPFSLVVTKRLSFFLLVGLIFGDDIMGRTFQIATLQHLNRFAQWNVEKDKISWLLSRKPTTIIMRKEAKEALLEFETEIGRRVSNFRPSLLRRPAADFAQT